MVLFFILDKSERKRLPFSGIIPYAQTPKGFFGFITLTCISIYFQWVGYVEINVIYFSLVYDNVEIRRTIQYLFLSCHSRVFFCWHSVLEWTNIPFSEAVVWTILQKAILKLADISR